MPRGRKKTVNLSYEQRIEEIEGKIEAHKNAISDLKKELKRCADEIASTDLSLSTIKEMIQDDSSVHLPPRL